MWVLGTPEWQSNLAAAQRASSCVLKHQLELSA